MGPRWFVPGIMEAHRVRWAVARDLLPSEQAVVALTGRGIGEKAEEYEDVAHGHAVLAQVTFGGGALPEPDLALHEHRIIVA